MDEIATEGSSPAPTTLQAPTYNDRVSVQAGFHLPVDVPKPPVTAIPFYFTVVPKIPPLTDAEFLAALSFFFSAPKFNARARFASEVDFNLLADVVNEAQFQKIECHRELRAHDEEVIEVVTLWPEGHQELKVDLFVYQGSIIFALEADWLPKSIGRALPQLEPFFEALGNSIEQEAIAEKLKYSRLTAVEMMALITALQPEIDEKEADVEGDALQASAIKTGMLLLKPQDVPDLGIKFTGEVIDEDGFGLYDESLCGLHSLEIDGIIFSFVGAAAVSEGEAPVYIMQYHDGFGFRLHVPRAGNVFNPITNKPLGHEKVDAESYDDKDKAECLKFIDDADLTTVLAAEMHSNEAILAAIRESFVARELFNKVE